MKYLFSIFLVGCTIQLQAQSITINPESVKIWGKAPNIVTASIGYNEFELIGIFPPNSYLYQKGELKGKYNKFNIGLFYKPIQVENEVFKFTGGTGSFIQRFPTIQGSYIHFMMEMDIKITNHLSLQYQHISNGFGIQNKFNPGLDTIGIKISL